MASADAVRDAFALVMCSLTGDDEGAGVIKDNAADLGEVAGVMADTVSELFRGHARALADGDPVKLLDRGAGRAGRGPDRAPRGRAAGTLPPGGLPSSRAVLPPVRPLGDGAGRPAGRNPRHWAMPASSARIVAVTQPDVTQPWPPAADCRRGPDRSSVPSVSNSKPVPDSTSAVGSGEGLLEPVRLAHT